MILFAFGFLLGVMFGFMAGIAVMALATASRKAQEAYDFPTTDSRKITDL